jgi:hypothetical protein
MDIIFDLDGTLANNEHRLKHLASSPKDWAAWNAAAPFDTVIEEIREVAVSLENNGNTIIYCTGREETLREVTEKWLGVFGFPEGPLYMRRLRDYRDDDVIKAELLEEMREDDYVPQLVFEDRARVVAMWRRRGLLCCQIAEGNF